MWRRQPPICMAWWPCAVSSTGASRRFRMSGMDQALRDWTVTRQGGGRRGGGCNRCIQIQGVGAQAHIEPVLKAGCRFACGQILPVLRACLFARHILPLASLPIRGPTAFGFALPTSCTLVALLSLVKKSLSILSHWHWAAVRLKPPADAWQAPHIPLSTEWCLEFCDAFPSGTA